MINKIMADCFIPPYQIHDVGDIETLSQIYPSHIRELQIPKLWNKTRGRGIVVAVLDTGIQPHADLIKNLDIAKCRSFIDGEDIFDNYSGHGLHCSGIIGSSNNEFGIVGIAPEVTLISIKVLNKNGRSNNDSILKGLKYCLELNPDVINLSLGGASPMPKEHEIIKKLYKKNIPIVCSVGNNAESKNQVLYPAQYDECIAVGSYSTDLNRSKFSSYGDTVDLLAPGEQIFSTFLNNSYGVLSGSSMAAPVVTGIIALLLSYYRDKKISIDEIKNILYDTAIDVQKDGKDVNSGYGIINPEGILFKITGIIPKDDAPSLISRFKSFISKYLSWNT